MEEKIKKVFAQNLKILIGEMSISEFARKVDIPQQTISRYLLCQREITLTNLYKIAEFDNYRKRTIKEKAELILNGGEKTITALLPVLDDLERAMQHMDKATDVDSLREGVELIINKLQKTLSEQGLSRIDTANADFTTDLHEAIAFIPAPTEELKGKVVDCVQAGYKLNEKVIRYAKVAVGQ